MGNRGFPELVHFAQGAGAGVIAGGTQVVGDLTLGVLQLAPGGGVGGVYFQDRIEGFLRLVELAEVVEAQALLEKLGYLLGVLVMGFLHGRIVPIRVIEALEEHLGTVVVGVFVVSQNFFEQELGFFKFAHFTQLVGLFKGGIGEFRNHAGAVNGAEGGIGDAIDGLAVFLQGAFVIPVGKATVTFGFGEAGIFNALETFNYLGIGRARGGTVADGGGSGGTVAAGVGPCNYNAGSGDAGRADCANDPGVV